MSHWAYGGLASLRRLGLMDGGYQNDYLMEDPLNKWRFQHLLNGVISRAGYSMEYLEVDEPPAVRQVVASIASALLVAEELRKWASETASDDGDGADGADGADGLDADADDNDAGGSDADSGSGGVSVLSIEAMERSHRQNMLLLIDAGLMPSLLEPYFSDEAIIPQAAEVVMLLANLYYHILL